MSFIRNILPTDKDFIFELGNTLFRKGDIPDLKHSLSLCITELSFVYIDNNQIIGFTIVCHKLTTVFCHFIHTIPNGYELSFFGISPTYQGKGIGSRLIHHTLLTIHKQSPSFTCWLIADIDNYSAIRMYKKIGFRYWATSANDITVVPGYIMGLSHRRFIKPSEEITPTG